MKEVEAIHKHPLFETNYSKLEQAEQERIYCRHQMIHLLDVARIAYIYNLEQGLGFRKEVIYAAAILHDIGKYEQYKHEIPHEIASADIAKRIINDLPANYFTMEERDVIIQAILEHRKWKVQISELGKLLYISDKKSRACYSCNVEKECNWSYEKKNMEIEV